MLAASNTSPTDTKGRFDTRRRRFTGLEPRFCVEDVDGYSLSGSMDNFGMYSLVSLRDSTAPKSRPQP